MHVIFDFWFIIILLLHTELFFLVEPLKNGEIALWPNGVIPYYLIFSGSEFSITEITGITYFSQK